MYQKIRPLLERFLLSPAYFILFGTYPVFELYVHNVHGVPPQDVFRPLTVSILAALCLFWIGRRVTGHDHAAALIVFTALFSFFYYGHFRNLIYAGGIFVGPVSLSLIWLGMVMLAMIWIRRHAAAWNMSVVAPTFNIVVVILLLFPIVRLARYLVVSTLPLERKSQNTVVLQPDANSPDIYYILLDAYTRSDVMKEKYGYDNTPFIASLKDMGFHIAECGQTNYDTTSLSLASTLNMDYLQNISDAYQADETDLLPAFQALETNHVRHMLEQAGYKTVVFASGFYWVEWRDADYFIAPPAQGLSEFEIVILFSSYARLLDDFQIVNLDEIHADHYRQRTQLVLNSFDMLMELPSPKFVFIHLIAPHEPYAFDKNGNPVNPDQAGYLTGYPAQAEFIGMAILPRLKRLIEESKDPPVILLQGDHGRLGDKPAELMKILNAYYLPGHTDQLHSFISPVNSFRVVFNAYFGTDFTLLEDISYYSTLARRYDFTVVPNSCPG